MKKEVFFGLDLDETLIHTVRVWGISDIPDDAEFFIYEDNKISYAAYIRNHTAEFLKYIDDNFTMFFYTRAADFYAEQTIAALGYKDTPLFHRGHTEVVKEKVFDAYSMEREKTYYKKDLNKIAALLNTDIDNIIFVDDVVDNREITPTNCVIQIPEYTNTEDFDLKILTDHLKFFEKLENNLNFIDCVRSLTYDIDIKEKKLLTREEKKVVKIRNH